MTKASEMVDEAAKAGEDEAEIGRLASLSSLEYERERKPAAEKLGVRASELDKAVKAERAKDAPPEGQGRAFELQETAPWAEKVSRAELLADTVAMIQRYLVLPDGSAEILAVWAVHTHCYDCFAISPRLAVTSAEKGCGKTTLLDVLACLVARPLPTSNATVAAIFRVVEVGKPTILMDEADTFLKDNDELRGILNTGHRRGGAVLRCIGDEHEPRMFSTWAPAAVAAIGKISDTLEDRSVACRMRRRKPSERVENFRSDRVEQLTVLARKMARWAVDNEQTLRAADPDVGELQNRVADNWRPLLAVADVAGGAWPERIRAIAAAAVAARAEQSIRVELLTDIKAAFERRNTDTMFSEDLVAYLISLEGRPWVEWKNGKPLAKASLARLLNPFDVCPDQVRIGATTRKGYHLPSQTETTKQAHSRSDNSHFQNETAENRVSLSETKQAYSHSDCFDVSLSREGEAGKGEQSGVPMRSDAPSPARPKAANGQALRPPTPPADATASLDAPVEETALSPSLVSDPASDLPKETAASSPALAPPDLDDIPAFLDRRRKSALADASTR
jgi:putative DNA primase/helicase